MPLSSCSEQCPQYSVYGNIEDAGQYQGRKEDVEIHHNLLCDVVVELCHHTHWSVSVEKGHGLTVITTMLAQLMFLLLGGRGAFCTR